MSDWRDDQETLCHCRNVPAGVVRAVVREMRPRKPEDVGPICKAGTGCKSCLPDIETIMRQEAEIGGGFRAWLRGLFRGRR